MKIIKIDNGEIRKGYELKDLSPEIKEEVISRHCIFLESFPVSYEDENGEMKEEYIKLEETEVIENIKINNYLFDEEGEILPILTHYNENIPTGKKGICVK